MSVAMQMADLATDEIVALVLDGQVEHYEEIVRRYQPEVFRIVAKLLDDRHATEDIVQQVFVNAWVALRRYEPGRDFGRWIRTIARNAVREELRRRSRYAHRLRVYYESLSVRLVNDDNAEYHQERLEDALGHCLGRLAPGAANLIHQRYTDGDGIEEIAGRLRISAEAVRSRLCRIRAKLRQCIDKKVGQP
jgi:RNA polymerase sigma-70 factor (ECF subfamily)